MLLFSHGISSSATVQWPALHGRERMFQMQISRTSMFVVLLIVVALIAAVVMTGCTSGSAKETVTASGGTIDRDGIYHQNPALYWVNKYNDDAARNKAAVTAHDALTGCKYVKIASATQAKATIPADSKVFLVSCEPTMEFRLNIKTDGKTDHLGQGGINTALAGLAPENNALYAPQGIPAHKLDIIPVVDAGNPGAGVPDQTGDLIVWYK